MYVHLFLRYWVKLKSLQKIKDSNFQISKKDGKDQETIQSSTTRDPGLHGWKVTKMQ